MCDLTSGIYEKLDDIEGLALNILENSVESVVVFPQDSSDALIAAVYAVLMEVLPNRWRLRYREVLAPPLPLRWVVSAYRVPGRF